MQVSGLVTIAPAVKTKPLVNPLANLARESLSHEPHRPGSACAAHQSLFGECFDECHTEEGHEDINGGCRGDHLTDDEDTGKEEIWDISSVQEKYKEARTLGLAGNRALLAHRHDEALRAFGDAGQIIDTIQTRNSNGTMQYNADWDCQLTRVTFHLLINTAATFVQYRNFQPSTSAEGKPERSRFDEAITCTEIATQVLDPIEGQHQQARFEPQSSEWANFYRVRYMAHQGMGEHEKTLQDALQVLKRCPGDKPCQRIIDKSLSRPLDVELLIEKLEFVQEERRKNCPESS